MLLVVTPARHRGIQNFVWSIPSLKCQHGELADTTMEKVMHIICKNERTTFSMQTSLCMDEQASRIRTKRVWSLKRPRRAPNGTTNTCVLTLKLSQFSNLPSSLPPSLKKSLQVSVFWNCLNVSLVLSSYLIFVEGILGVTVLNNILYWPNIVSCYFAFLLKLLQLGVSGIMERILVCLAVIACREVCRSCKTDQVTPFHPISSYKVGVPWGAKRNRIQILWLWKTNLSCPIATLNTKLKTGCETYSWA